MEVCKLFNRLVYFCVKKVLGGYLKDVDPFFFLKHVATWAGRVCLLCYCFVFLVTICVTCGELIPYEWSTSKSVLWFFVRLLLVIYVFFAVTFHYTRARLLDPVKSPGKPGDPFCVNCNQWKGPSTSHCKACDRCIFRMDHHCPHIGQCVGAHNQSHFYLFIFWLLIASASFFLLAHGYWMKWFEERRELMVIPEEMCMKPFCFNRYYRAIVVSKGRMETGVKFCALLFGLLHFMMWGFVGAYTYIISVGLTMAMKMFQKSDVESRKAFSWEAVKFRWRRYFNCQPNESLLRIFLVPMIRRTVVYDDYKLLIK